MLLEPHCLKTTHEPTQTLRQNAQHNVKCCAKRRVKRGRNYY